MRKIRVLLIEDNRLLREGITEMIKNQPDLQIVGVSGNYKNSLLGEELPEVVLLDHCLRDQDSLRVAETVKKKLPAAKVIVMGLVPVKADVAEFVKKGISGFILKDSTFQDFLTTIRSVAKGEQVLPPALTGSLFSKIIENAERNGNVKLRDVRLTKRQREIIDLIGEGLSNKEIAQKLHLATHTVKSHVHNILEKLALHSRLQVATYAHKGAKSEQLLTRKN